MEQAGGTADTPVATPGKIARAGAASPARAVVVMGVSGTGKSTLGALLGTALHASFLEGDTYHAPASVAKMEAGLPLTDEDRWPWLDRLGAALGAAARADGAAVAACSALRRCYRERLAAAAGVPLFFAFLDTDRDEIARRMHARRGHYMPTSLLDSQLETLERPGPDEPALRLDAHRPPGQLCADVRAWLGHPITCSLPPSPLDRGEG